MPLPAGLQNSHGNGRRSFLIFVADPRTVRLCMKRPAVSRPELEVPPLFLASACQPHALTAAIQSSNHVLVEANKGDSAFNRELDASAVRTHCSGYRAALLSTCSHNVSDSGPCATPPTAAAPCAPSTASRSVDSVLNSEIPAMCRAGHPAGPNWDALVATSDVKAVKRFGRRSLCQCGA